MTLNEWSTFLNTQKISYEETKKIKKQVLGRYCLSRTKLLKESIIEFYKLHLDTKEHRAKFLAMKLLENCKELRNVRVNDCFYHDIDEFIKIFKSEHDPLIMEDYRSFSN